MSTIQTASAAIAAFHLQHGYLSPCRSQDLKLLLTGVRKRYGKTPKQKNYLSKSQYREFLTACLGLSLAAGTIRDFRTAWTELILLHTSSRWGDLRILKVHHFKFSDTEMKIHFPTRKNDQEGKGHFVYLKSRKSQFCPVALTKRYFSLLNHISQKMYDGFVIPTITGSASNMVVRSDSPASYQSCRNCQKEILARITLDPSHYGLHTGRISSSVFLRNAGFNPMDISAKVGWAHNSTMPLHYARKARKQVDDMDDNLAL